MLVLSRRVGEEVVIDGNIRVTLISARKHTARLGIDAPHAVRVDRREVFERRLQEESREHSRLLPQVSHD